MEQITLTLNACLTVALALLGRFRLLADALAKVPGFVVAPDLRTSRERNARTGETTYGPANAYLAPQRSGKAGLEAGAYYALDGKRIILVNPMLAGEPLRAVATIAEAILRALYPDGQQVNAAGKLVRKVNPLLGHARSAVCLNADTKATLPAWQFTSNSAPATYVADMLAREGVKAADVDFMAETTQGAAPQRLHTFKCDNPAHATRNYRAAGESAADFRPGGILHKCMVATADGPCGRSLVEVKAATANSAAPAGLTFAAPAASNPKAASK